MSRFAAALLRAVLAHGVEVLMVGDPSCGKSQMLRFVMNTAATLLFSGSCQSVHHGPRSYA